MSRWERARPGRPDQPHPQIDLRDDQISDEVTATNATRRRADARRAGREAPPTRKAVTEVCDGLAPVLRRRGMIRSGYSYGTFKENLLEF